MQVVAYINNLFLFIDVWLYITWIYQFAYSSIQAVSIFSLLNIELLQTYIYRLLCEHKLSFFCDKCPGMRLLSHLRNKSLVSQELDKLHFRVLYHFTLPPTVYAVVSWPPCQLLVSSLF